MGMMRQEPTNVMACIESGLRIKQKNILLPCSDNPPHNKFSKKQAVLESTLIYLVVISFIFLARASSSAEMSLQDAMR
jgi:hypothetical protein